MEHFAGLIFGKNTVQSRCIFRVTRNADITVDEGMFDHDVDYREIMSDLLKKRRKLAAEKKALYAKYRAAQQEMRQAVAVKTNIDYLLGVTDGRKNKEQER